MHRWKTAWPEFKKEHKQRQLSGAESTMGQEKVGKICISR